MDLVSYLKDQISFLTEEFERAQKHKDVTMRYIVESRLDEAKKVLNAVKRGEIDRLD
ncbi:hypothetical protein LOSG293_260040 [Secundilactobacillus oryzae JCM 18671]|uniref:Uncharacterized protein n=1 Tax=Secundilactobacillus oryzae JCM 18671 TaxID=1291743 RepID=A0A081BJX3_9LACO|nr:hypothetical protein [Secundilactobacillus oryzae]GAK48341.1 hypothetical protein LOSG293_260040 [Secundilactobacillus oryzae JCM 18671]